jgi:hypothetical protein
MFIKDGIRTLANIVIVDPTQVNLSYTTQRITTSNATEPRKEVIATNTPLINSSL